jgi:hypothetical protein
VRRATLHGALLIGSFGAAAPTPALAADPPHFYVEQECRALPLDAARAWCIREERCNEKWLVEGWRDITAGVSRDAVVSCATLAKAATVYQYWLLRHCLAPASETGDCK